MNGWMLPLMAYGWAGRAHRSGCTVGGGPYFKHGYHVVKGVDLVVPVDIYVPGCPPRPEVLLEGLMRLQDEIRNSTIAKTDIRKAKEIAATKN